MRRLCLTILITACLAAAPPASGPATTPMRLEDMEPLAEGTVRYIPPPMWDLLEKRPDGLAARYRSRDAHAFIDITVIPQDRALHQSAKDQMALIIGKGIREGAAKNSQKFVLPPRVQPDERFFLKMRDAMSGGGMIADRIQMYRIMGLNLVHVAATAQVENLEESQDVFELAERTLDTMRIGRGPKRVVYGKAQLRAIVPLDWKETKTDNPNGVIATYVHPKDPSQQIIISSRIIPKAAREDETKRKTLLENMVDDERKPPAPPPGPNDEVTGSKYLRQIRYTLKGGAGGADAADNVKRVDTRYLIVGDLLISVRSICNEADADAVGAIADKVADDLKPVREQRKE